MILKRKDPLGNVRTEGGELGAGEGAVGDYAVDEGLVDGAAEESPIARSVVWSIGDRVARRRGRADLMIWYGAGL